MDGGQRALGWLDMDWGTTGGMLAQAVDASRQHSHA